MAALHPVWPLTGPRPRPGAAVTGHTGSITTARFGLDGGFLVSGDEAGLVIVSDSHTGARRHTFRWPAPPRPYGPAVSALATGPGDRIAAGLVDGSVHVVELRPDGTARELRAFAGEMTPADGVDELGFFRDGNRLLSRQRERIRVREVESGRTVLDVTPEGSDRSGPYWRVLDDVLAVADGPSVTTWSLDGRQVRRELRGHAARVVGMATLPGLLVTTDEIGVVRTWDGSTGGCLAAFTAAGRPAVDARTGRMAVPSAQDAARILDPRSGDPESDVQRHTRRALRQERIANGMAELAWRLPRWADPLYERAGRRSPLLRGLGSCAGPGLRWTVLLENGEDVDGDLISFWHSLTFLGPDGRAVERLRLPAHCVAVMPLRQDDRLATVGDNGLVDVWSQAGEAMWSLAVTDADVTVAVADQEGTVVAVGDRWGGLRVVDPMIPPVPDDGNEERREAVVDLAVDPGGSWVATTMSDRTVVLRDLADGRVRRVFKGHVTGRFRSSTADNRIVHGSDGDGPWLAHADDDGMLRVRNPVDGARISLTSGANGDLAGIAGPDWLAVAEPDGRIRLRDPRTGDVRMDLVGHTSLVRSAAVDRAGTLLVSSDGVVRVWDLTTGAARLVLPGAGWNERVCVDVLGRWFAVVRNERVSMYAPDGRLVSDTTLESRVAATASSPDGRLLLARADGALTVAAADPAGTFTVSLGSGSTPTACAVSPDGLRVAIGDDHGSVQVHDLGARELVATIDTGGAISRCAWAAPDRLVVAGRTGLNLLRVADPPRPPPGG